MTDYKGKVIDTCSDCGKRGPMWSGMPYKCKGCSDKMSKSNDIFEKAWINVKKEAQCCAKPRLIERRDGSTRCRTCQQSKFGEEKNLKKDSKPDYLDFDGDGDKKEPMKNALKNKKVEKGMGGCSVCKGGALPCIGKNVMTSHGVMCNNQVLDMTMG